MLSNFNIETITAFVSKLKAKIPENLLDKDAISDQAAVGLAGERNFGLSSCGIHNMSLSSLKVRPRFWPSWV